MQSPAWFVPAVIAIAVLAFVAWADLGAVPGARLCAGLGDRGADHRLPLRARPRDADVDHDRDGTRRPGGRADQERRGAGDASPRSTR